jgi:hypothetical protein
MPFLIKDPTIDDQHVRLREETEFEEGDSEVLRLADQIVLEKELEGGEIQPDIKQPEGPSFGERFLVDPIGSVVPSVKSGLQRLGRSVTGLAADVLRSGAGVAQDLPVNPLMGVTETPEQLAGVDPATDEEISAQVQQIQDEVLGLIGAPEEPGSIPEGLIQAFIQFLPLAIPGINLLRGTAFANTIAQGGVRALLGEIGAGALGGAIADFVAFDPTDPRFANLIQQLGLADEGFLKDVVDFFAAPDEIAEADAVRRFQERAKNTLEGGLVGTVLDGIMTGLRGAKGFIQKQLGRAPTPEEVGQFLPFGAQVGAPEPGPLRPDVPGVKPATGEVIPLPSRSTRIAADNLEQFDGFTVNKIRGDMGGVNQPIVAPFPDIEGLSKTFPGKATAQQIEEFSKQAEQVLADAGVSLDNPNIHIGGWFDTANGVTHLDVSISLPPNRAGIAEAAGKQFNQKAVMKDLVGFEEIPTGGTGEGLPPGIIPNQTPTIQKRLQFLGVIQPDAPAINISKTPFDDLRTRISDNLDTSVDENGEYVLGNLARTKSGTFALSGPTRNPGLQDLEILGATLIAKGVKDPAQFEAALKHALDLPEGSFKPEDLEAIYQGAEGQFDKLLDKVVREDGTFPQAQELLDLFNKGKFRLDWYNGTFDTLVRIFDGNADLFAKLIAATSPQAPADITETVLDISGKVKQRRIAKAAIEAGGPGSTNLDMALDAYKAVMKARNVEEFISLIKADPQIGEAFPARMNNLIRAFEGGDLQGPKVANFYKNIVGIADALTVDSWMQKIFFGRNIQGATQPAVDFFTEMVRPLAAEAGVSIREFQAALWTAQKIQDELGDAFFSRPASELDEAVRPLRVAIEDLIDEQIKLGRLNIEPLETVFGAGLIPPEVRLRFGTAFLFSRAVAGGLYGAATTEPDENALRRSMTFALGAAFLPAVRPRGFENLMDQIMLAARRSVREQRKGLKDSGRAGRKAAAREVTDDVFDGSAVELGKNPAFGGEPPIEVSLDRIPLAPDTPESIARSYEERIRIQTRRSDFSIERGEFVRADPRTVREAEALKPLVTPDFVKRINPGTTMNDSEALALAQTMSDVGLKLKSLAEQARVRGYDPASMAAFDEQLALFMELDPSRLGVRAEAGRTERILGFEGAGARSKFLNNLSDTVREFVSGIPPRRRVEMVAGLELEQIAVMAAGVTKPTYTDMFIEMWVNGLLSGPKTHLRNTVGNMTAFGAGIAERGLARRFSKNAGDVGISPGEATAMLKGATGSLVDAWRYAWEAFKSETSPRFGTTKFDIKQKSITSENLQQAGAFGSALDRLGTILGLSGDRVGRMLRLPGRAILAGDEFFKTINFQSELRAQAHRTAWDEATKEGLEGPALRARVMDLESQILLDPPPSIKQAAKRFATYNTFQQALGPRGQHFQAFMDHPFGRIVMPFQRTPINLAKFAGERTPLAIASSKVVQELSSGDAARRQMALSKMYLGSMTMGMLGVMSASGLITTSGPKNFEQRRVKMGLGWQPTSLIIDTNDDGVRGGPGDTFIPLDKIEPFGSLIILAVDAANAIANLDPDDPAIPQITNAVSMAAVEAFNTRQFVMGFSQIIGVISGKEANVQGFIKNFARGALPYSSLMRDVRKQLDPILREARGVVDKVLDTIPGLSKNLRPVRNLFGEVVPVPDAMGPDMISFLTVTTGKDEPVFSEMDRLEFSPSRIPEEVSGIELTDKQKDRLAQLRAKPSGIPSLREALLEEITDPSYSDPEVSDERRKSILQRVILDYKEEALDQLRDEFPELDKALDEIENKLEELRSEEPIPRLRGVTP